MFKSFTTFKSHRRAFLTKGIAATAGVGLLDFEAIAAKPCVAEPCLGSASDAIILLLDLLIKVLDEAYFAAGAGLREANLNCAETLQVLYNEVDALVAKIKSKKTARATGHRIEELLEIGRTNIRYLRNAEPRGGSTPMLLASLSLINQEVSRAAQDLLPSGDIVLDEDAKQLLQKIINSVNSARQVPAKSRFADKKYSEDMTLTRNNGEVIRNAIFDASAAAESESKTRAHASIRDAITALKQLPMNSGPSSNVRESAAQIMIKCLEGAQIWVDLGSHSVPIILDEKTGKIMLNPPVKKHHPDSSMEVSSAVASVLVPSQGVGGLLNDVCGPNNLKRRCACYWATGMAWLSAPKDPDWRVILINGALIQFACNPSEHKDTLVKRLAGK